MECLISMASGDPLDAQKDTRWPKSFGTQVKFEPRKGDADYVSEAEGDEEPMDEEMPST